MKIGSQFETYTGGDEPANRRGARQLRERLAELLRRARELEAVTQAPANLPRVKEPSRPVLPLHESFLPGSILTTLFRNPKTGRTVVFKGEELGELDGMAGDYLVNYYLAHSLFTEDDAARLRNSMEARSRQVFQLMRCADWRADVYHYEVAKEGAILNGLLQLRLLTRRISGARQSRRS